MNFKLLKLRLKIGWMKLKGKISRLEKSSDFTVTDIDSPSLLLFFPVSKDFISRSVEELPSIMNSQIGNDANFTFILNTNIEEKINLSGVEMHTLLVFKSGKIDNAEKITDKIFFKKFDIIIDLNINFNLDIALMINKLDSTYKIGFKSDFSDLFYNVQLSGGGDNPYSHIKEIIS